MYPVLFYLGGYPVYSYGFSIMVGVLGAFMALLYFKKKIGLSKQELIQFFPRSMILAVLGGKLFLWIANWKYYTIHPEMFFNWEEGRGFMLYGSMFFFIGYCWWFARNKKIEFLRFMDYVVVSGALLQFFGKTGCLLAGCCFGKVCEPGIGIVFTSPISAARPIGVPLYPVQIADMIFLLILLFMLLYLEKRILFKGQLFLLYLILFSGFRFMIEFLRGDLDRGEWFVGSVSQTQIYSLIVIGIAVPFYFKYLRKVKQSA